MLGESGYDVVVVGGGNAGLVAAISALESGQRVLLLEKAPRNDRGGNSKYTRDFRFAHGPGILGIDEEYPESEFLEDLMRVTRGQTDPTLARMVVESSLDVVRWADAHGVRWQRPLPSTLHLGRTNAFVLGGGKALVNRYYRIVEEHPRADVIYGADVESVEVEGHSFRSVEVARDGSKFRLTGGRLILSSGGFESNLDLLERYWGDAARDIIVRGTHNNTGRPMLEMIEHGAATVGRGDDGHMVAVDARSPRFNGGIVTRVDSVPFGVVLNTLGLRFYDEGEDIWPKRYAIWGKLV
ncbi:MAG: FAD-binding protein, partial [Conexivisphaera sp.]